MKWFDENEKVISCHEKVKILKENLEELRQMGLPLEKLQETQYYKDALEDAILFGVSRKNFEENIKQCLS